MMNSFFMLDQCSFDIPLGVKSMAFHASNIISIQFDRFRGKKISEEKLLLFCDFKRLPILRRHSLWTAMNSSKIVCKNIKGGK